MTKSIIIWDAKLSWDAEKRLIRDGWDVQEMWEEGKDRWVCVWERETDSPNREQTDEPWLDEA